MTESLISPGASSPGEPGITQRTAEALRKTRPWVKLISILLWVMVGLMLLGSGFMIIGGVAGTMMSKTNFPVGIPSFLAAAAYCLCALLYVFPAVFLWRYGRRIGRMLETASVNALEGALEAQKSFWKFMGILAICIIAFYALMLVVLLVAVVIGALR